MSTRNIISRGAYSGKTFTHGSNSAIVISIITRILIQSTQQ